MHESGKSINLCIIKSRFEFQLYQVIARKFGTDCIIFPRTGFLHLGKENNIYILTVPSKVYEFNVINEKSVNVSTMTTLANDKKMLIVEAKQAGVSDVSIRTEESLYQVRFVVGPDFQDESDDLIMIDIPSVLIGGK